MLIKRSNIEYWWFMHKCFYVQTFVPGEGNAEVNMASTALTSLWTLGQTNIKSTSNLKPMSILIRDNQSALGYMG